MTPETQHSVFCEPEWADECRRCAHLSMSLDDACATAMPHGRMAYTIVFSGAWHFIDLSVMPRTTPGEQSEL